MFAHRSFVGRRKGRHAARPAARFTLDANPRAVNWLTKAAWSPTLSLWAAVGFIDGGGDAYILTSPGLGAAWTERANPQNNNLRYVLWTGQQFVAVGDFDGIDAYALTSADGAAWTARATAGATQLYGLATEGGGKLLAGGQAAGQLVKSDDHGATWANTGLAAAFDVQAICWTGQRYVVVGNPSGANGAYILTTPDRAAFTQRANPLNLGLWSVAFGAGRLVAVGDLMGAPNSGAYVVTSDDHGATWQGPYANPAPGLMRGVCFTGQQFIATSYTAQVKSVLASRNGEAWARVPQAAAGDLVAPSMGDAELVIVGGSDGAQSVISRTRELQ